ncbi:MAG TPA: hemagglutinin repeat-containing protein, partial [Moraxellaceae bacterium]|nr:hemagglutinin repeat-containing protein [Moraxellaceae bacterium]
LAAGGSVTIAGATSSVHSVTENQVQKDGLMKAGTGWGFTAGERIKTATQEQTAELYSGSTVGSVSGNVTLRAGDAAVVEGSALSAGQDISIDAARIELLAGREQSEVVDTRRMTEMGITLSAGGAVIESASAIQQSLERADDVENERLERVKQLQAAYKAYQLYKAAAALAASNGKDSSAFRVSLTSGFSIDESTTTTRSDSAIGSALLAGGKLTLIARGGEGEGADPVAGDILSRGSVISAGNAVTMTAANDIQLLSAASLYTTDRDHESLSAGAGIGASVNPNGTVGAIGATGYASGAASSGDELMLEHQETTVDAASFTFSSGRDTVLRGAVVKADSIAGDVGRDLVLASEQDHITFGSEDMSLGGSVTALVGANASWNASAGQISSDYLSVIEQTGLFAGKGGFDIRVGGATDLTGAVIASTASADRNMLDTGSLAYRDIGNHAEWSMEQVTVGSSLNFGLADGDSDSNVTRAAVSAGTLTVRDDALTGRDSMAGLLRDAGQAHQVLGQTFDETEARETAELVQSIVDLGTTITRDQRQDAFKALAAQKYLDISEKLANGQALSPDEQAWMKANGDSWNDAYARSVVGGRTPEELATSAERWNTGGVYSLGLGLLTGAAAGGMVGFESAIGNAFMVASPDVSLQVGNFKESKTAEAKQRMEDAEQRLTQAKAQGMNAVLDIVLAQQDFDEAQSDFNFWDDGGLGAISLHAISGALQGFSTGNVLGGFLANGLTEGSSGYLAEAPAWLQKGSSIGIGLLGGSVGGSPVSALQGAGIAYTTETYNRQLHLEEMAAIRRAAKALALKHAHDFGRSDSQRTVEYWENLLTQEALAQVDSQGLQERNAFLQSMGKASRNPLTEGAVSGQAALYISDTQVAMDAILGMKGAVLEVDPLYGAITMFSATAAQKNNELLYGRGGATPGISDFQTRNYVQSQNAQLDARLERFHEQVSLGMGTLSGSAESLYIVEELALGGVEAKAAEGVLNATKAVYVATKGVVQGWVEKRAAAKSEELIVGELAGNVGTHAAAEALPGSVPDLGGPDFTSLIDDYPVGSGVVGWDDYFAQIQARLDEPWVLQVSGNVDGLVGSDRLETSIVNDVLIQPRVGYGEKGFGSGNKVDFIQPRLVLDASGNPIPQISPIAPGRFPNVTQENPFVVSEHGFTDLVDNYAGYAQKFELPNGATLYQLEGSLRGVSGRFDWIVDPKFGGVTHRQFVTDGIITGSTRRP